MAPSLGDVILYIRGDSADAEQALGRVESRAQQAAGGISGFFRDAFAVGLGGIITSAAQGAVGFFGDIIGGAFEAVGSTEMLEASLGSLGAKEILKAGGADDFVDALSKAAPIAEETLGWIERLAIQSPFGSDDVASAFQLASAYGFVSTATASVSEAQDLGIVTAQRLTQAMLNQVAASGRNPAVMSSIALALGQMSAAGKVTATDLNQLTNAGVRAKDILADKFTGGSVSELNDLVSSGLLPANDAILALVEDMELMGDAAALMGNTWTGIKASLGDIAQFAMRDLFGPALDELKPAALALVSFLQGPTVREGIATIGAGLAALVAGPGAMAVGLFDNLGTIFTLIGMLADQVGMTFSAMGLIVQEALAPISSYLAPIGSLFMAAFGPAIGTIQTVIANFALLGQSPQTLLAALSIAFDQIVAGVQQFGSYIQTSIAMAAATFAQFGPEAAASLSGLPGIFGDIFAGLASMAGPWGEGVVAAFADGIASAVGYVTSALGAIASTVSYWLTPGSPPPLLPDLDIWGAAAGQVYFDAWGDAQFDALDGFSSGVEKALKLLTDSGAMAPTDAATALIDARGSMVAALEQLRTTGEVSTSLLDQIAASAPAAGDTIRNLAQQYLTSAQAAQQLEEAERNLADVEGRLAIAAGDIAAAQASGDAGMLAAARNREQELKARRKAAQQQKADASAAKKQADESAKRQEKLIALQQEQLDLLKKTMAEEAKSGGGGSAANEADLAAEAQWRRNYALADTATKLRMLQERQAKMVQGSKEWWDEQTKIDAVNGELVREQEQLAKKAEAEAKKELDRQQRVEDARWDYNYSIADTAGKLDMLRAKQAKLTEEDEEYWELAKQIAATEEQLRKEQEEKAKAAKGAKGKGAGGAPTGPDLAGMILEQVNKAKDAAGRAGRESAAAFTEQVQTKIRERAGAIREAIVSPFRRAGEDAAAALSGIGVDTSMLDGLRENWMTIAAAIAGGVAGLGLAMSGIPWVAIWGGAVAAVKGFLGLFSGSQAAAVPNMLIIIRNALLGLLNPFTILITLGAALATAWVNNLMGIRESVAVFVAGVWAFLQPFGALLLQFWQQNGAQILATLSEAWMMISSIVGGVVSILALVIGTGLAAIGGFISAHSTEIVAWLTGAWNLVSGIVMGALALVQGVIGAVLLAIQGDWAGAWNALLVGLQGAWNGIILAAQGLLAMFVNGFALGVAMLGPLWDMAWNLILMTFISIWSTILTSLGFNTTQVQTIIGNALAAVKLVWDAIWLSVQTVFSTVWAVIVGLTTGNMGLVQTAISSGLAALNLIWTSTWQGIQTLLSEVWTEIATAVTTKAAEVKTSIETLLRDAASAISGVLPEWVRLGGELIMGLAQGVAQKAVDLARSVIDAVKGALGAGQTEAETGSPSRLFNRELGRPIGQGIVGGVDDMASAAEDSMRRFVQGMAGAGQETPVGVPVAAALASGAAGAGGAGAGATGAGAGGAGAGAVGVLELLQAILDVLRSGAVGPVQVGPNTIAEPLDIEEIAYQVMAIRQRKARGG